MWFAKGQAVRWTWIGRSGSGNERAGPEPARRIPAWNTATLPCLSHDLTPKWHHRIMSKTGTRPIAAPHTEGRIFGTDWSIANVAKLLRSNAGRGMWRQTGATGG